MNHAQISKSLAVAIGWKDCVEDPDVQTVHPRGEEEYVEVWYEGAWRIFDYRDWNVIGLIAKRHDCFPMRIPATSGWTASTLCGGVFCADTPQLAIALAVIEASK